MEVILEDFIAGVVYGDFDPDNKRHALKAGTKLTLIWEHTNAHDNNAIKIMHGKRKLGYIPRVLTHIVHRQREQGNKVRCIVKKFARTNPTHRMILVQVLVKRNNQITTTIPQF